MSIPLVLIRTDKDTHFTGSIAQNAHETESLTLPDDYNELFIENISIQSDQNLEWDVMLWSSDKFNNADLDLDAFVALINFPTTAQKQIAGANQYYVDDNNLSICYPVADDNKLHISLCNRSATAKNAGATGEVIIKLFVRPAKIGEAAKKILKDWVQ